MGNTLPPRMCREADTAVMIGRRRRPNMAEAAAAAPRRVSVAARKQRMAGGDVDEEEAATRRRRGEAATEVTVKIVMKRKDAEELVARLNAQAARERKARMARIKCELRAADGGASPDAWRPRLAPIQEN